MQNDKPKVANPKREIRNPKRNRFSHLDLEFGIRLEIRD
jgi:hypothetical protein